MTSAEINLAMPRAWGDRELSRFQFRAGLFARRGFAAERAEHLADRLALRDMQGDDRRVCMECEHLQADHPRHGRGCFAAQQGWFTEPTPKNLTPLLDTLQRCEHFTFQKP